MVRLAGRAVAAHTVTLWIAAVAVVLLGVATAVTRADTTFTFESPALSDGTQASGECSGITFLAGSGALASFLPEVRGVAASQAHSGTHVLQEAPDSEEFGRPAARSGDSRGWRALIAESIHRGHLIVTGAYYSLNTEAVSIIA
jgi:hypothetical protein